MIRLIITDLDGTFLNSQGDFDRKLFAEVKQLMLEKGVVFAACTGKQCERVEEFFGPEDARSLWILGDSATRIKHEGEYVYESLIPNELGRKILARLEETAGDTTIIACTPEAAVIRTAETDEAAKVVRRSYARVDTVDDLQQITSDFVKITVYDRKLQCFERVKLLDDFLKDAYIVASEAAWIDISNAGVHKGTTVAKLQELIGVAPAETMVFGDGLNDVELLQSGDFSFAMRNAFDEVKDAARYVTGSNDENGVLTTIQQLLSLQSAAK